MSVGKSPEADVNYLNDYSEHSFYAHMSLAAQLKESKDARLYIHGARGYGIYSKLFNIYVKLYDNV